MTTTPDDLKPPEGLTRTQWEELKKRAQDCTYCNLAISLWFSERSSLAGALADCLVALSFQHDRVTKTLVDTLSKRPEVVVIHDSDRFPNERVPPQKPGL